MDKNYVLLLDLDAIMDTRMGTILKMTDGEVPFSAIEYRTRIKDDMESLSKGIVKQSDYEEAYASRDVDTLKRSMMTGIVQVLANYVLSIEDRKMRRVDIEDIVIHLNFHPYKLPAPIAGTFRDCLSSLLPGYVGVEIVNIDPVSLTSRMFLSRYSGWVTYDFNRWLEKHHEDLLVNPMNQVSVIIPRLTYGEPRDDDEYKEIEKSLEGYDKHGLMEMVMEDFVHIEHLPITDFCYISSDAIKAGVEAAQSSSASSDTADANESKSTGTVP